MTASPSIKTPMMKLPVKSTSTKKQVDTLIKDLSKLIFSQIVCDVSVTEEIVGKVILIFFLSFLNFIFFFSLVAILNQRNALPWI